MSEVEGLTEQQWARLRWRPDYSGCESLSAQVPLSEAVAWADAPNEQLGTVLPGALGVHGAALALRFRTGERLDEAGNYRAKYGGDLHVATDDDTSYTVVDVLYDRPTPSQRRWEGVRRTLKWLWTGDRLTPTEPMATVSSRTFR
jgi:hypothetical protein